MKNLEKIEGRVESAFYLAHGNSPDLPLGNVSIEYTAGRNTTKIVHLDGRGPVPPTGSYIRASVKNVRIRMADGENRTIALASTLTVSDSEGNVIAEYTTREDRI